MAQQRKRSDLVPIFLIAIGVLLVIGVLVWQFTRSNLTSTQAPTADQSQAIPEPNIKRVSLADAKNAFDAKSAVFVDVRDPDSYKAGHVPGALNIPLAQMETRYKELDPSQWIILYCT